MGRSGNPRKRDRPAGVQSPDEAESIYITSAADPDAPTECLISWRGLDWRASAEDVRCTAVDLFTMAAWADMMMFLMAKIGLDPGTMTAMMSDLLSQVAHRDGRKMFGTTSTFSLMPVGSSKTGRCSVLLERHGRRVAVDTEEARGMGLQWLEAVEASESDQLVAEALRAAGGMSPERIQGLFAYLRELRTTRPGIPARGDV